MKLLGITMCLVIAGCGASPESTFYALAPTHGAPHAATLRTVELRRLSIPGYLDRPEIVRSVVDYRLGVAPLERWGEPLDEMLGRVLAEDIEQRAPGSSVFTEGGAIRADADASIEIDVRRFDVGPKGEVALVAEVALKQPNSAALVASRSVTLRVAPKDGSTPALVAAMSDLVGKLADEVAPLLKSNTAVSSRR